MKKLFLLFALSSCAMTAVAQTKYVVTDLGTLGGTNTTATDINNLGQVTGSSGTSGGQTHAFRTAPNSAIKPADDLGTLGGATSSSAEDINDAGQVAGSSNSHAFRSSGNFQTIALTDLGTFDGNFSSFGSGINFSGQVTGSAHVASTAPCFFAFSNSAFRTTASSTVSGGDNLGTLLGSCRSAQGWAINDLGVVVGDSATNLSTGQPNHAFRAAPSAAMVDLHPAGVGYDSSIAVGVNNTGQIVGTVNSGPAFSPTAQFCYRTVPGQSIQLPADSLGNLGGAGPFCSALGINSAGDVVGSSFTGTAIHGFIYTGGAMNDLNTMIAPGSGWEVRGANAINDNGQIVGNAWLNGVQFVGHAVRLDPVDIAISNLITQLSDPTLALTAGQINSLTDKLLNALDSIEVGSNKQAINQLNAFINSVASSLKTGKISAQTAATLTAAANAIIAVF